MTIFLETDDYAKQFLEMADRDSFSQLPPQPVAPDMSSNQYAAYADAAGIEFSQDEKPGKYTEAQLSMMPEWKAMSKTMYRVMEGYEFIGSDKQASDYGMDLINEFNWNVFGPAGIPGESGISSPGMMGQLWKVVNSEGYEDLEGNMVTRADVADQLMGMMDLYADTKTNGNTIKRAFRGLFGAPETYASLGGGLAAPLIKGAAMKTANMTARKMLMATAKASGFAAKYGAANPGKGGMIAGGAYAGMYAAANEAVAAVSSAPRSLQDSVVNTVTQTLAGVVLGGAAGKGIAKGAEVLSPVIKNKLQQMGVSADERMAEKGPLSERLMSGFDPTDAIDPVLSAAGKAADVVDQVVPIEQATAMSGTASAADMVAPEAHENRIATRLPTAVRSTEDPVVEPLQIGLEESKADPAQFEHNVKIVQDYPNMTEAEAVLPPEEASEAFITHVKDNLLWIHDKVPEETRQRSKLWYDGARAITDRWSAKHSLPDASIAGVLAALSPQMDWYKNVSLAERVITTMEKRDFPASKEMVAFARKLDPKTKKPKLAVKFQPIIDDMLGKTLDELDTPLKKAIFVRLYDEVYNPRTHNVISPEGDPMQIVTKADGSPAGTGWGSFVEITKAVEAVESGGSKTLLTPLMGTQHKVRSFYNNILDPNGPNGDVTIDTHAVAAGLLKPLSGQATEVHHNFGSAPAVKNRTSAWKGATKNSSVTGVQGNYGLYAEAYRRAAKERGILPREMQSITWEAARGLFTDVYKRAKKGNEFVNVAAIDNYWQNYRKGKMTIDEVRDAIEQHAGGINPPTWKE